MTEAEIITGNDEICKMCGFESNKAYVYKVPNLFPCKDPDTGWSETNVQAIQFNEDWNMLIGAYNIAREKLSLLNATQKELLEQHKNFITNYSINNFFHLGIDGQVKISGSYIKLVDFAKWYNGIIIFNTK